MNEGYTNQDLLDACVNPPSDIFVTFGGVIHDFRNRTGMRQDELAEILGISWGQLAAIENNHYPKLTLRAVDSIATVMNVNRVSLIKLWYQTNDMPS